MMELKDIADALQNLVQIEVKTVVGNYTQQGGKIVPSDDAKILLSRIDLLTGDITTVISHDFLQEPLHNLIEYQKSREAQSQQLIHSNIQALKELATLVATLAKESTEVNNTAVASNNTVPIGQRTGSSTA